jgi:glycosyltransferase involved in cell wall biosynthesis
MGQKIALFGSSSDADPSVRRIRAFLDGVRWFIRPRNTDWRYVRFALPSLSSFESRIEVYSQHSWRVLFHENATYICRRVSHKIGHHSPDDPRTSLDYGELNGSGCDVVFSHRGFPSNAAPYPVIWQNSILDPEMSAYYHPHGSPIDLQKEIDTKGPLFARAAIVNVSTQAEVERLGRMFPDIADRFVFTPFFVPELSAADPAVLTKHFNPTEVRVLFVGKQGKTKGLDVLIEAFQGMAASVKNHARLIIVSALTDGVVSIPDDPHIEFHAGLRHEEVMREMRWAHILAIPSRFESYGFAYTEAMSQGTVPIAPNWEVQRELVNNGEAGVLAEPGDSRDLRLKLERLIEDEAYRVKLAGNAYRRFCGRYAPEQVAKRFLEMFELAKARGS